MPLCTPDEIIDFWFREIGEDGWFTHKPELDKTIQDTYGKLYEDAVNGSLKDWEKTPMGMLALIVLLNQFPRHLFRDTAKAYATDWLALDLARTAIIKHFDDRIDIKFKLFFYLPFMHAESMGDQRLALFYIRERTKNPTWLERAEAHFSVIQKFGRFPERNQALARTSNPEELAYLNQLSGL